MCAPSKLVPPRSMPPVAKPAGGPSIANVKTNSMGNHVMAEKYRRLLRWLAVGISTLLASDWAFWAIIENFHEGWWPLPWSAIDSRANAIRLRSAACEVALLDREHHSHASNAKTPTRFRVFQADAPSLLISFVFGLFLQLHERVIGLLEGRIRPRIYEHSTSCRRCFLGLLPRQQLDDH
jgi:hypothetical protein